MFPSFQVSLFLDVDVAVLSLIPFSLFVSADPLVGSIANQYISDRKEHDRMAVEWTKRFAT